MYSAITIDIDTYRVLCNKKNNYLNNLNNYELTNGLSNFFKLLQKYSIKGTFFVVGKSISDFNNIHLLNEIIKNGHEIANHSFNHIQGFRFLSVSEQKKEIKKNHELVLKKLNYEMKGFRTPGWNFDNTLYQILEELGYKYNSSLFPTFLAPIIKIIHYISTINNSNINRTTMGPLRNIFKSLKPSKYNNIFELPIAVLPFLRLPFNGTFNLTTGLKIFNWSLKYLKSFNMPVIYEFHLVEFVDYHNSKFYDQIINTKGQYIPKAVYIPIEKKIKFFENVIRKILENYDNKTLLELYKIYDTKI